jgi:hypothetical protein
MFLAGLQQKHRFQKANAAMPILLIHALLVSGARLPDVSHNQLVYRAALTHFVTHSPTLLNFGLSPDQSIISFFWLPSR